MLKRFFQAEEIIWVTCVGWRFPVGLYSLDTAACAEASGAPLGGGNRAKETERKIISWLGVVINLSIGQLKPGVLVSRAHFGPSFLGGSRERRWQNASPLTERDRKRNDSVSCPVGAGQPLPRLVAISLAAELPDYFIPS